MNLSGWFDTDGWPNKLFSPDGNVTLECKRPKDDNISKEKWIESLSIIIESLCSFNRLGVDGHQAVSSVLKEIPQIVSKNLGIISIAYVQQSASIPLYTWPDQKAASHRTPFGNEVTLAVPFKDYEWQKIRLYHGNHGPVANVGFSINDALVVYRKKDIDVWFVLLETYVGEQNNDAIIQKMAIVEVHKNGSYQVHENNQIFENAGGGGPYDPIISDLVVTARTDVIGVIRQGGESGDGNNVLISLNLDSFQAQHAGTFRSPSPELIPVGREVDLELMKYLRRFPEHVTEMPGDSFERIIAEILASHGFSDIQLNVRNNFGEIDILAFEGSKDRKRKGYIIECKRYKKERNVTLREAHILAMKRILMQSSGINKAMLVTTSDFTKPTRQLYDSAWGLELKAYDEVVEWLRNYKLNQNGLYL